MAKKNEYLEASKFTIAGDSIHYPGFVTEKIVQPFIKHSIPIYFGSTLIDVDFNTESFVWCKSGEDLQKTIDEVIYLDTHDDAYIDMLMTCPLNDEKYLEKKYVELEKFLVNIFSQEKSEAFRRVRFFCAQGH